MNYGTWYDYRGRQWRFERMPYSVTYDRRRPILVTVKGAAMMAHVANCIQAREAARKIIDSLEGK